MLAHQTYASAIARGLRLLVLGCALALPIVASAPAAAEDSALSNLKRQTEMIARRNPGSKELAESLLALADAFDSTGDAQAADEQAEAAAAILRKLDGDTPTLAALLNQLGARQHDRGDFAAARLNLQEALRIAENIAPDGLRDRQILFALADTARESGDLEGARALLSRLQSIQRKVGVAAAEQIDCINLLGSVAAGEGNAGLATEYFNQALDLEGSDPTLAGERANTLNQLGLIALASTSIINPQRGDDADLDIAEQRFREAEAILTRLEPESTRAMNVTMNLGVVLGRRGHRAEAEAMLKRILPQAQRLPSKFSPLPKILLNLGTFIGVDESRQDEALDYIRRAIAAQEKLGPDTLDIALMLDAEAYISKDVSDRERLRRRSYSIARAHAAALVDDEARQHFASILAFHAMELVRAQIALGRWGDAFVTSEESRAFALTQLISERSRRLASASDAPRAGDRAASLRAAEDRLELLRFQAGDPAALASAETAVAAARAAYLAGQSGAAGAVAQADDRPPLDQAEVGRIVDPDTVYLSFSWDQRGLIWFLVHRDATGTVLATPGGQVTMDDDGIFMMAAAMRAQSSFISMQSGGSSSTGSFAMGPDMVGAALEQFRRTVTDDHSDAESVTETARSAFRLMFPAAAQRIILGAKHLVIAPDGPLWGIPFAALVVNQEGPPDYLGDHVAVTYTQSLRLYQEARAAAAHLAPGEQPSALIVGDPQFPEQQPDSACGEADRLCASGEEARRIAALYRVAPLTRAAASKRAVEDRMGAADVIHLATHAVLDQSIAMASSIRLAASGPAPDDGRLEAWDVLDLKLRAELVVLSGCETALGDAVRAEGMVGLTRAFQAAGARSVVASQWRVEDAGTAALMEAFHRLLRAGLDKDVALQRAMQEVRKDRPHPYYWSAFLLLGDPRNAGLGAVPVAATEPSDAH